MKIYNVHERQIQASPGTVGTVLDSLSGPDDRLWPWDRWPAMKFDSPLCEGVNGGHGPVTYSVSEYVPGRRVVFQFDGKGLAAGIDGHHFFEVVSGDAYPVLRHVVDAECDFRNWLKWHVIIGPLHDALLEDALDKAESELSGRPPAKPARWNTWVRFLRWMIRKRQ